MCVCVYVCVPDRGTGASDRRAFQQLALIVHIKLSDLLPYKMKERDVATW